MSEAKAVTRPRRLLGLRPRLLATAAIALIGVAAVLYVIFSPKQPARVDVEKGWKTAISQYGIESVYPPEEDFAVGDLFVEIVADNDPEISPTARDLTAQAPFSKRALKIDHVDVRQELEEMYSALPSFGDTAAAAPADPAAPPKLFDRQPRNLPIAVFPDVSASNESSASAGWLQAVQARFGGSREADTRLGLHSAQTYGLPNARAAEVLDRYCAAPKTAANCTEAVVRKHLRSLIGARAERAYLGKQDLKLNYIIEIRFFMVVRVFLALDIVNEAQVSRAMAAYLTGPGAQDKPRSEAPSVPDPTSGVNVTVQQRLDAVQQQLKALQTGGTAAFATSDFQRFAIDQKFARPVAVGYVPMVYDLKPSEPK